tara:strand:+ start:2366 stop:4018 length:1653 start_codon:yes stop_codon:yes gene_type:complete
MVLGVYVRVSSNQQVVEGESLETQIDGGERFCKENGYEYKIYNEGGKSGGDRDRNTYNKLLRDLKENIIDGIWMFSTSRVMRESVEFMLLVRECKEGNKLFFVGNKEYDLNDPGNRLMLSVLSAFDEHFRSQNTYQSVENKKRRLREGRWINGTILFGYKKNDSGGLEIDKVEMEVIESILNWYISGKSQKRIVGELFAKYGMDKNVNGKTYKFNRSWVGKLLRSRYYVDGNYRLGLDGEYYDFEFESGINIDLWNHANRTYKSLLKHKREEKISWLEGKMTCVKCDGNLTIGYTKGWVRADGTFDKYYYVSCRNNTDIHKKREWSIRYEEIEVDLIRFVEKFLIGDNFIKSEIKSMLESEGLEKRNKEDEDSGIPDIVKEIEILKERKRRLVELYIELHDIDINQYKDMVGDVDDKIEVLKLELSGKKSNEGYIGDIVDEWLVKIGELDSMSGREFIDNYVENIGIRVVKRDWFNKGRLIKYRLGFKDLNVDWKKVERELVGGKKNKINYLSNSTLNTNKMIINKRNQKILLEVIYNGFQYKIEKIGVS